MKIVELKIDDTNFSGVDAVALVESPAIETDFIAFNKVKMADMTYNDYPQAAIDAARRGIELNKENNMKCATQVGKVRAQQLVNGEKLSLDTIKRMRSFLIRQKGNYELATRRKDYNACGYISYLLWGGEAALPWAEKKLRQAGIEFSKFGDALLSSNIPQIAPNEPQVFEGLEDACQRGYKAIGLKTKNGRKVPNCVPIENFDDALVEEIIKDTLNLNVFGYPTEYFYMCPGAKATFEHLISMEVDEDTKGMIRSAAQIADNIFDLEEDVIENGIAVPEDVELASILISDFKDLILEIDEITGMTHDVSYMDDHLQTIVSYAPEEFNINVNALPNFINEASTGGRKRNFAAELAEKQMLVGPLMTPGKLIPRIDEETNEEYEVFFAKDTIEKIAYKMMQDKLVDSVNIEHDGAQKVDDAYLVETWIVKDPEHDKSTLYGFQPIAGQWYGMYKINNRRVWNEYIKTGKVKGFSVEGYFYNNILTKK
jgi:hypothetical protein